MWRLILLCFAFLGWSFYVLSGGADYEPRIHSIQARAKLDDTRPFARPVKVNLVDLAENAEPVPEDGNVSRNITTLANLDLSKDTRFQVTLASVATDQTLQPILEADPVKADALTDAAGVANTARVATSETNTALPELDIRKVTGSVVNMRDGPGTYFLPVGKLKKGNEVEVLSTSDGWVEIRVLETDQVAWMADWLVTASAN